MQYLIMQYLHDTIAVMSTGMACVCRFNLHDTMLVLLSTLPHCVTSGTCCTSTKQTAAAAANDTSKLGGGQSRSGVLMLMALTVQLTSDASTCIALHLLSVAGITVKTIM